MRGFFDIDSINQRNGVFGAPKQGMSKHPSKITEAVIFNQEGKWGVTNSTSLIARPIYSYEVAMRIREIYNDITNESGFPPELSLILEMISEEGLDITPIE